MSLLEHGYSYVCSIMVKFDKSARTVIDRLSSIVNIDHFKTVSLHSSTPNQTGLPEFGSQNMTNIGQNKDALAYRIGNTGYTDVK